MRKETKYMATIRPIMTYSLEKRAEMYFKNQTNVGSKGEKKKYNVK